MCRNIQPRDVTRTTMEHGWQMAWKPPQEQPWLETFISKFILSFSRLAHRQRWFSEERGLWYCSVVLRPIYAVNKKLLIQYWYPEGFTIGFYSSDISSRGIIISCIDTSAVFWTFDIHTIKIIKKHGWKDRTLIWWGPTPYSGVLAPGKKIFFKVNKK